MLLIEDNRTEARPTQQWLGADAGAAFEVEWVEQVSQALDRLTRADSGVCNVGLEKNQKSQSSLSITSF